MSEQHQHDMQPIPDRRVVRGRPPVEEPREPASGHQVPEGAFSLQAVFADAIIASKKYLDEAAGMVNALLASNDPRGRATAEQAKGIDTMRGLGEAYARLAQALQHGAPGQRF